jgi:hypothetical protein
MQIVRSCCLIGVVIWLLPLTAAAQYSSNTQNHYIKTASPDAIAAMKQFSEALLCSACAPDGSMKVKGSVQ